MFAAVLRAALRDAIPGAPAPVRRAGADGVRAEPVRGDGELHPARARCRKRRAPTDDWVKCGDAPVALAPDPNHETRMQASDSPKGPASYFPSIEKKYGEPIEHWLELTRSRTGMRHMELVAWLKTEHGLGHGHANAIVASVLAERR